MTLCGVWVASCWLVGGYNYRATQDVPTSLRVTSLSWLLAMPVAAAQLVLVTAISSGCVGLTHIVVLHLGKSHLMVLCLGHPNIWCRSLVCGCFEVTVCRSTAMCTSHIVASSWWCTASGDIHVAW
jgi:hypothetical protein